MKKLFTLTTLIFTVMFLSNCDETPNPSGNWKKLTENDSGDSFYLDFETIRKQDGYVYWWELTDLLKPTTTGVLSYKSYNQGDCGFNKMRELSGFIHKEPMGRGIGIEGPTLQWTLVGPDSLTHTYLKSICEYAK